MPNFPRPEARMLAGLPAVFFVEARRVTGWPDAQGAQVVGALTLQDGAAFGTIISQAYTPQLAVPVGQDLAGLAHATEVSGFYQGESLEVANAFLAMQGRRFVLLIRDPVGRAQLIGSPRGGLQFFAEFRTGQKAGQPRGWAWAFKGKLDVPPRYWEGTFTTEDGEVDTSLPGAGGSVRVVGPDGTLITTVSVGNKLVLETGFSFILSVEPD